MSICVLAIAASFLNVARDAPDQTGIGAVESITKVVNALSVKSFIILSISLRDLSRSIPLRGLITSILTAIKYPSVYY